LSALNSQMDRRTFINSTAAAVASTTALASTAFSYSRILGANDRVSLGHVGIGSRGPELDMISAQLQHSHNVEMTAICDLWSGNREAARAANEKYYGRGPRSLQYLDDLLALKDVDAVIISTPEHSHCPILKLVADAGKDVYVEKPLGNNLADMKAARDAVLSRNVIVQVGTQHRSEPYQQLAYDTIHEGALGEISKIEIAYNYNGPRWRGRPEVPQLREQDTDWKRWLMNRPFRPFDPRVYFEFRLYRDFSSGIADQWMSHAIDQVHWFMDDYFPKSVVAQGGIFCWRDGRENPDTFQALLEYPKGFLVSYSTSFGNDAPGYSRYMGKKATLFNIGGEGSPRYQLIEEIGNHEEDAEIDLKRKARYLQLHPGEAIPAMTIDDMSTGHMANWFECIRSRRQPHSTVHDGFAHSVACIMAAQSYWSGKKLFWDTSAQEIVDRAPAG
jgi:predicted dehydrogenase